MIKALINVGLVLCVVLLACLCYVSIRVPVRFDEARRQREAAVKARLVDIRRAQAAYHERHGRRFTACFDTLIQFLRSDSMRVGGEGGSCPDSLRYIPYGRGIPFEMEVLDVTSPSGLTYCLLEVRAPASAYLQGLDRGEVAAWQERQEQLGRYAGLKIGDLESPNNNAGNWE